MKNFSGIIAPVPTPFGEGGKIAPTKVGALVSHLVANGVNGVFAVGTWGSFPLMSMEERASVAEAFCQAGQRLKVPVIIQIGSTSTETACELARHAVESGADAIASTVPYYYASAGFYDTDAYKHYFASIVDAAGQCPVMLYNNPRTTGVLLSPSDFVELCTVGVRGIKDGSVSASWLAETFDLLEEADIDCDVMPGNTSSMLYGLGYGARAFISGTSVVTPALATRVYDAWQAGRFDEAARLHRFLLRIQRTISAVGKPPVLSYGLLRHAGVDIGEPRRPWQAAPEEATHALWQKIDQILANI